MIAAVASSWPLTPHDAMSPAPTSTGLGGGGGGGGGGVGPSTIVNVFAVLVPTLAAPSSWEAWAV